MTDAQPLALAKSIPAWTGHHDTTHWWSRRAVPRDPLNPFASVSASIHEPAFVALVDAPAEEIRRKLGKRAVAIWLHLLAKRDNLRGVVWAEFSPASVLPPELTKLKKNKRPQATRALAILNQAGLVVQFWGGPGGVCGVYGDGAGRVPAWTVEWLKTAVAWGGARPNSGGKRPGAGRPKRNQQVPVEPHERRDCALLNTGGAWQGGAA